MDMKKRIASGQLFLDHCQGLDIERQRPRVQRHRLNALSPDQLAEKEVLKKDIFGASCNAWIETPFLFTYGSNIHFGTDCYVNYQCNFIDDGQILIGDRVMFGANVTIATVGHPVHPDYRTFMYAETVTIKDNCWIGAGVVINPGVTIGENCVIGSGSVVTKDIPDNTVAVGNPCRVLRSINEHDYHYYRNNRPINASELQTVQQVNQQP